MLPGGRRGGRNEVYFAEIDPTTITPRHRLPGFREGSDVIVLIDGYKAAELHAFTRSSTGAYLTEEVIEAELFQVIVDIGNREVIYWNDWESMDEELSQAIWNAKPKDVRKGGARVTPMSEPPPKTAPTKQLERPHSTPNDIPPPPVPLQKKAPVASPSADPEHDSPGCDDEVDWGSGESENEEIKEEEKRTY